MNERQMRNEHRLACVLGILLAVVSARAATWYVDDDAPDDPGPGTPLVSDPNEDGSAAHPFDAIQEGIAAATSYDTVLVRDGTYIGPGNHDLDYGEKDIIVRSENGPANCIIDCQQAGRGFIFQSGEGPASVLEGVTITNGYADEGGGVLCYYSPTVSNCVFSSNSAYYGGGAVACHGASPTLNDCTFSGNSANSGAGLSFVFGSPTLANCVFSDNTATWLGGGMWCASAEGAFTNCTFSGNSSGNAGGAAAFDDGPAPDFIDCTFYDNLATTGGAVWSGWVNPNTFSNCTFSHNSALYGGGVYCVEDSTPILENTIIALSALGEAVYCEGTSSPTLTCCDVYGNGAGPGSVGGQIGSSGNFALNPRFCYWPNGDLTLRPHSPCAPGNHPTDPNCGLIGAWPVGCDPCPEDIDGDGDVDPADLTELLVNYGTTSGATNDDGDIDGDADVDLFDLAALLAKYGTICP